MTLAQLLAARPVVLLDFDGPVCAVFGGELPAAKVARQLAVTVSGHGVQLPMDVAASGDPFDVLQAASRNSIQDASTAEHALRDSEVRAVATAPMTPGLREVLDGLHSTGHAVTIVSNNSEDAVRAFLNAHGLLHEVEHVVARVEPDPALLKPHPHLINRAIRVARSSPDQCVLIGDSVTDVVAAHSVDVVAIAYANKPGKRATLATYRPEAIIDRLDELAQALRAQPSR